jgi:DNA-binding NtrC family response regulator
MAVRATKLGALDFLEKPLSTEKLLLTVENALRMKRLEEENRELRAKVGKHEIIWRSEAMRRVLAQVARVAAGEARVCILGETGTGKELIARAVHDGSPRKNGPFVTLNCAAVPQELIESELFGHETCGRSDPSESGGASPRRPFSSGPAPPGFRISNRLAAAPRTLWRFAALIEYFSESISKSNGWRLKTFTPAAVQLMEKQPWPGNVRELRNAVERLLSDIPFERSLSGPSQYVRGRQALGLERSHLYKKCTQLGIRVKELRRTEE